MGRPSQKAAQTRDYGDAGRLQAVHRNHEETYEGETRTEARFPRPGFGFLVGPLTRSQFGIRQTLADDLRHHLYETPCIVAIVTMIEPEYLLCDVRI